MSAKNSGFPKEIEVGSVRVKIYKIRNKCYRVTLKNGTVKTKPRFSFKVAFFASGKRFKKMFADFSEAKAYAEKSAGDIDSGHLGALPFTDADARMLATSKEVVKPTGLPLDLVAKEYAALWLALGGKEAIVTPLEVNRPVLVTSSSRPQRGHSSNSRSLVKTPRTFACFCKAVSWRASSCSFASGSFM